MNDLPISGACGVLLEFNNALRDAQAITMEYGNPIKVHIRQEGNVTRDAYGSIISRGTDVKTLSINCASANYNPSQKQLEKMGLFEKHQVTIKCAVKDFMDAGVAFDDIEMIRSTVEIMPIPGEISGATYEIKEKARTNGFANGYLYYSFGLDRRG